MSWFGKSPLVWQTHRSCPPFSTVARKKRFEFGLYIHEFFFRFVSFFLNFCSFFCVQTQHKYSHLSKTHRTFSMYVSTSLSLFFCLFFSFQLKSLISVATLVVSIQFSISISFGMLYAFGSLILIFMHEMTSEHFKCFSLFDYFLGMVSLFRITYISEVDIWKFPNFTVFILCISGVDSVLSVVRAPSVDRGLVIYNIKHHEFRIHLCIV